MASQQRPGRAAPAGPPAVSVEDQVRYAYWTPLDKAGKPLPPRDDADDVQPQASKRSQFASPTDKLHAAVLPRPIAERTPNEHPALSVQWASGGFPAIKKSKSAGALRGSMEHPGMKEMRKHYKPLMKQDRKHKTFLPMAWRKTATVPMHSGSAECQQIHRSRWSQTAVAGALRSAATAALEPLEEDKMRLDAMRTLMGRAKYRMEMEGISKFQQDLVLSELPDVMHESMSTMAKKHPPDGLPSPSSQGSQQMPFHKA